MTTKNKHEIGEDLDVYYEDEPGSVAVWGHVMDLEQVQWEAIERLWKEYSSNDIDAFQDPPVNARAILVQHLASSVRFTPEWGKKRPVGKYEQEEIGGQWTLLNKVKKPQGGRGWFAFTLIEVQDKFEYRESDWAFHKHVKGHVLYPTRHASGLLDFPPHEGDFPPCFGHWPAPDGTICDQCSMDDDCQDSPMYAREHEIKPAGPNTLSLVDSEFKSRSPIRFNSGTGIYGEMDKP
jgi:hypothetical protein